MIRRINELSLSALSDEDLEVLYTEGHLGNVTKYISELYFFYNRVEEEIKRRNLINKK